MMVLEKAYARYHGSFSAIEGGFVHSALVDFVPGSIGELITMTDTKVKADVRSGALWEKLLKYVSLGYLLGAGSPGTWRCTTVGTHTHTRAVRGPHHTCLITYNVQPARTRTLASRALCRGTRTRCWTRAPPATPRARTSW